MLKVAEETTITEEQMKNVQELAGRMKSQFINLKDDVVSPIVKPSLSRKAVRIFTDGVYDMVHSGHYNALRQA